MAQFVAHGVLIGLVVLPGLAGLAAMSAGCAGASPSGPTQQTPPPSATSITALSPNRGSTGGGTPLRITATGIQAGLTVTVDNVPMAVTIVDSTTLQGITPAHAAGAVDVAVKNLNNQVSTLAGGYTFAPPESFDFNGTWTGSALAHPEEGGHLVPLHADMGVRFTVEGNRVISFACGYSVAASPLARPLPVSGGEFASTRSDGLEISGRVVSDRAAVGTIATDDCPATRWSATKQ